jgi:murein DD-endopeptidase MepM/ murein hydrolase activator NlpD
MNNLVQKKNVFLIKSLVVALIFSVLTIGSLNLKVNSLNSTQYNSQKSEIDTQTDEINKQLSEIGGSLEDVSKKKNTLQEESVQVEKDITKINDLITKTEDLIKKIDAEIKQNEKEIDELLEEMKVLLLQIQKNQQISPIESLISSRNFGEAISKLYALSTTQNNANDLKVKIEEKIKEQEANLEKQKKSKADLESSKILLQGKKDYLNNLITNYKGKEDEYAKQIATLKEQQKINDAEAKKLQDAWEAEKARLAEEAKKQNNNGGGNNGGGSGGGGGSGNYGGTFGCWFEDSSDPGVPSGFFQRPVSGGYVSQTFGCPSSAFINHDAVDIAFSYPGEAIYSSAPGFVENKGSFNVDGYGNWILIKHTLPNGYRIYSLYAHMGYPSTLAKGQAVSKDTVVGKVGMTGWASGYHVHFMLYSQSYETNGLGSLYGKSKSFNPGRFVAL